MNGSAIASLPREDQLRARAEWPYEVGFVYLRDLMVDDTYQRPPHHHFISEMATRFDETLVGTIDVNARESGEFAILDGQQRFMAMSQVGKTACYCSIYQNMTIEDEAGFFYRKNRDRKSMNAYYAFRARAVAGDTEAITIRDTVERQGFHMGENSNERDRIGAIRAVEWCFGMSAEHREESLTPTLKTIHESMFGRKGSLDAMMLQGLGRFWQTFRDDEVQAKVVNEILAELGPANFIGQARERQAITSTGGRKRVSQPWWAARILADEYNRRLRGDRAGRTFDGKLDQTRLGF